MKSEIRTCSKCNGTGKIVIGYGAICTEVVEKVKKCPECKGTGHIVRDTKTR
ncbi:MAG: Chaperone protein DnaJ [Methanosaeta sp. PtaU1.Bin112]|nr:MAG: Chaperone protein DnaJ [Methanosaeta sp. PtaU1.Bin112]